MLQLKRLLCVVVGLVAVLAIGLGVAHAQLRADELLLVVNGNAKDSVRLAEFYARARFVPEGRIVKLDLTAAEEISFDVYERNIVPPIRQFLRDHKLEKQVKCIVMFYGTPIRIMPNKLTPDEQAERVVLQTDTAAAERDFASIIVELEKYAQTVNKTFVPSGGEVFEQYLLRADQSARILAAAASQSQSAIERDDILAHLKAAYEQILGESGYVERFGPAEKANPALSAEQRGQWETRIRKANETRAILRSSADRRYDPTERARAREIARTSLGAMGAARLLKGQLDYLSDDQTVAAVDSELSLLWSDYYPRAKWMTNVLNYRIASFTGPRPLMVSRIDGPDDLIAADIILGSIKAERDGLKGRVVIDARGLHPGPGGVAAGGAAAAKDEGYAIYDQTLRNLAEIVRAKTTLPLTFDDQESLLGVGAAKGVAVYAGWYSVSKYVRCCSFVPGAVAYHIASYEMRTLRNPTDNGWVKGLLKDGVAATLGAVSEPYLMAFPDADEFFPLLFTGKLTLAEVYWKTQKTASWQVSLIGDPLYNPFARNPALKVEDLSPSLRRAIGPDTAASQPTSQPTSTGKP